MPRGNPWRPNSLRLRAIVRFLTVLLIATFAAGSYLTTMGERGSKLVTYAILYGIPTAITVSLVVGVLFPRLNRFRYLPSVILRTALLVVSVVIGFAIGLWLYACAYQHAGPLDTKVVKAVQTEIWGRQVRDSSIFVLVSLLVFAAFEQLTRRLGPGALEGLLLGRYFHPRREERVFMFLDMKDSTSLAERLGDLRYSALVRDFFHDLTYTIVETGATVAEYVGDEVVLTWKLQNGLRKGRCVGAYLLAKETLNEKALWYEERYGVAPDFKAGLHCGSVVATEVGDVKTELVFHGDVLNTAARIRSLCSDLQTDLLISQRLADLLSETSDFQFRSLGPYFLKGKERSVPVATLESEMPETVVVEEEGLGVGAFGVGRAHPITSP